MSKRDPKALQRIGWALRQERPTVWIDALYWTIDDKRPPLAIVTGVRFKDEAQMIRQMGGRIVRVVRVEHDGRPFIDPERDPDHAVEREIVDIPADAEVVARSGDVEALTAFAGSLT